MDESTPQERSARIRLGARIGRGGMAEVFAARLAGVAGFEKDVAVKRVLPRYANDELFLQRFLHEARLAARLSHPNVVQIFELGNDGRDHYLVMEAVRGVTLRAALSALAERHERMPPALAVFIGQAVCAGLAHAHELKASSGAPLGIVHRDVTPQNVLLGFDGVVKLIDFGIARAAEPSGLTSAGSVVGKAQFIAPEQILGGSVDARADLFSLGVVLFEMFSGERPFVGEGIEVLDRITQGDRPRLRTLVPTLDAGTLDVVERALATDVAARWQSARALGAALSVHAAGGPSPQHELEALLSRLFPAESAAPWPVEIDRADGSDHTRTVDVPARAEITLVSDPGFGPPREQPEEPTDVVRQTDTHDLQRRRRTVQVGLALAAFVGVLGVVFVALTAQPAPPTPVVAAAADAGAVALPTVAAPAAAAPAVAAPAVAAADAGHTTPTMDAQEDAQEAAQEDAREDAQEDATPERVRKRAKKTGSLIVETRPWSEVRVDGKLVGITPLSAQLPVGPHTVVLRTTDGKLSQTRKVTITTDEPQVLRLDLRR